APWRSPWLSAGLVGFRKSGAGAGPGEVRLPRVPLGRLLVGVGDPERHLLLERPGVDHEPDRQALPRETTGEGDAAQVQDVADRGVPQVLPVVLRIALE